MSSRRPKFSSDFSLEKDGGDPVPGLPSSPPQRIIRTDLRDSVDCRAAQSRSKKGRESSGLERARQYQAPCRFARGLIPRCKQEKKKKGGVRKDQLTEIAPYTCTTRLPLNLGKPMLEKIKAGNKLPTETPCHHRTETQKRKRTPTRCDGTQEKTQASKHLIHHFLFKKWGKRRALLGRLGGSGGLLRRGLGGRLSGGSLGRRRLLGSSGLLGDTASLDLVGGGGLLGGSLLGSGLLGGGLLLGGSLLLRGSSLLGSGLLLGSSLLLGSGSLLGGSLLLSGTLLLGSGGLLGGSSLLLLGSGLGSLLGELGATGGTCRIDALDKSARDFKCITLRRGEPTLGLLEDTLLNTSLQGLVEERVEHVLGDGDVVVLANILLELLSAGTIAVLELW